jgi:hypothetical protein
MMRRLTPDQEGFDAGRYGVVPRAGGANGAPGVLFRLSMIFPEL